MAMGCDLMVMPFSRSRSMASSTCSFMSFDEIVCVISSRRSASVDFPWSMWAMMQKLRVRSGGMRLKSARSSCPSAGARALEAEAEPRPDLGGAAGDALLRGVVVVVEELRVRAEIGVELQQVRVHVGID